MLAADEGNMRQGATLRNIKERIADR
jgi:hypothetical protein